MDIFKWAKDIENIYEVLLNKAKGEKLDDINALTEKQEEVKEILTLRKQEVINLALRQLSEEIDKEVETFKEELNKITKRIEEKYQTNKDNLVKVVIEKIGLDF